ncbi:LuxR C-terminal-related transcriptional regulator, partial [Escherichia coli]|nr:LuxR C-terminal-related transcriptional regulator [Escherichia coli]
GYSNVQIAGELEVTGTTTKSHISDLNRKLGVAHRQAPGQHAQKLLKRLGYGVRV